MTTGCSIRFRRLRTESGHVLGRVFDFRCQWQGDHAVVTHLIYGTQGWLENLGFRLRRPRTLAWSRVLEVRDDEIVVRDSR